MGEKTLEYWVFRYDINTDDFVRYNILNDDRLLEKLKTTKFNNMPEVKECLEKHFRSLYWSRTEWEYMLSGMFTRKPPRKYDVWYQIEPNLYLITDYVIKELKIF